MDCLIEVAELGIDAILCWIFWKFHNKYQEAVNSLTKYPLFEVNENFENFVNSLPQKELPYVAIQGLVKAIGPPLKSSNSKHITGVIRTLATTQKDNVRCIRGSWTDRERDIAPYSNKRVPFVLKSPTGQSEIEVLDVSTARVDLETIAYNYEDLSTTALNNLWGLLTGIKEKGVSSTERMLREGTLLTGVGKVYMVDGQVRLRLPDKSLPYYLTTSSVSSVIKSLNYRRKAYKTMSVLFGGIGIVLLFFLGTDSWVWINYTKKKSDERKQRIENIRKERIRQAEGAKPPEEQLCVVCMDNPLEIILLPCGHVCICEDCNKNIHLCPLCRGRIDNRAVVYFP